jgi:magnesium chelatase family protein
MPLLEPDEAVEVTRIHSLAGQLPAQSGGLIRQPPFRSPHHSASAEGILGGGRLVKPGEISLAHRGVLFLDETAEFRITVLQALREPLEDRVITISRAEGPVRLPADFQLILAANGCPCGRLGSRAWEENASCFCSPEEIHRYWRKIGGALLDRIELRTMALNPEFASIEEKAHNEESSATIRARVLKAVEIQRNRFKGTDLQDAALCVRRNAGMSPLQIEHFCPLASRAKEALNIASSKLNLSGRAYHAILRTARTIADLDGEDTLDAVHVLEAIEHRRIGDDPYDVFSMT